MGEEEGREGEEEKKRKRNEKRTSVARGVKDNRYPGDRLILVFEVSGRGGGRHNFPAGEVSGG